jgi:hypothetical protein
VTAEPQSHCEMPGTRASVAETSPAVQLSANTTLVPSCDSRLASALVSWSMVIVSLRLSD